MTIDVRTTPTPIETVTPIRPSEAIRLGCLIAPVQARGTLMTPDGAACAIGTMFLGLGLRPNDVLSWGPDEHVVWSLLVNHTHGDAGVPCPVDGCRSAKGGWLPHLNDDHRWTREQIADWLEGLGL